LSDSEALGSHESFRTNDSFYRSLVESLVGYAVFTTDKKGNISSWNAGAQKLFGFEEKEIIAKNVLLVFRKKDMSKQKLQKEFDKVKKKGKIMVERFYVHKSGVQFWASGLVFSLGDEKDVSRGFTFIVRDLTEKMEFEKRKDAFISTATHELRTPITSMKLYAQIMEQEIKKSKNKQNIKFIGELNNQLNKVMSLMDYLLDVAKIQKGKLDLKKTSFSMNILVEETISTIQLISKKHTIVQEGKINEKVYADRDRLKQVLINLITNAIKYSPGENKVIVIGSDDAHDIIISVKDFGFGISKSDQVSIFGRFYRATTAIDHNIEGIGLGLYVAQQIVHAHKGKMWLESEKDKGSSFFFSIPRKAK
jgi:PAS domain S-box-containing protein